MKCEVVVEAERTADKIWAKWVSSIDRMGHGGYRFIGDFLKLGNTYILPVGAVVIVVYINVLPGGKSGKELKTYQCDILKVIADGTTTKCGTYGGKDWAHKVSKDIERLARKGNPDLEKLMWAVQTILKIIGEKPQYGMVASDGFADGGWDFHAIEK